VICVLTISSINKRRHGASEVVDAVFEQSGRRSNVREISDAPDPYKSLRVARDVSRKASDYLRMKREGCGGARKIQANVT
jgi:hypothetical protein